MSILDEINPFKTTKENMAKALLALAAMRKKRTHRIGPGRRGIHQQHRQITKRAASKKPYNRIALGQQGMYATATAANRALARFAAYMASHPNAAPKDYPAHIRRNAFQAQRQFR